VTGGSVAMLEACLPHVQRRIDSTQLLTYPFEHLVVENILPDDVYNEIMRRFPSGDSFVNVTSAYSSNFEFQFGNFTKPEFERNFGALPPDERAFWRAFSDRLCSTILRACLRKMRPLIDAKLATLNGFGLLRERIDVDSFPSRQVWYESQRLLVRTRGFGTDPHLDSGSALVVGLLYLATDDAHPHLGTDLYRICKPFDYPEEKLCDAVMVDKGNVELAYVTPYRPNTLAMMLTTERAVHGNRMREQDYFRNIVTIDAVLRKEVLNLPAPGQGRTFVVGPD